MKPRWNTSIYSNNETFVSQQKDVLKIHICYSNMKNLVLIRSKLDGKDLLRLVSLSETE